MAAEGGLCLSAFDSDIPREEFSWIYYERVTGGAVPTEIFSNNRETRRKKRGRSKKGAHWFPSGHGFLCIAV